MNQRASGILLHPTSLFNPYPIGDLGPAATAFADFTVESGQRGMCGQNIHLYHYDERAKIIAFH